MFLQNNTEFTPSLFQNGVVHTYICDQANPEKEFFNLQGELWILDSIFIL